MPLITRDSGIQVKQRDISPSNILGQILAVSNDGDSEAKIRFSSSFVSFIFISLGSILITLRQNGMKFILNQILLTVVIFSLVFVKRCVVGRLVPLYTNSQRKLRVLDLVVINRTFPLSKEKTEMEIFGFPFMFQVESFRSCEHVFRHLVEQSLRYLSDEELTILLKRGLFDLDSGDSWINTDLLPFKIRLSFDVQGL